MSLADLVCGKAHITQTEMSSSSCKPSDVSLRRGVRWSQNLQLNLEATDPAEYGCGLSYNENTNPN